MNFISNPISQTFIGFGLNLSRVEFLDVIQCPKFHWIWTKPHDTLGNIIQIFLEIHENVHTLIILLLVYCTNSGHSPFYFILFYLNFFLFHLTCGHIVALPTPPYVAKEIVASTFL